MLCNSVTTTTANFEYLFFTYFYFAPRPPPSLSSFVIIFVCSATLFVDSLCGLCSEWKNPLSVTRQEARVIRSMTNCSLERKRVQMSRMKHLPKVHDRKYHKFRKMGQSRPLFVYFRPFLITISIMQIEKV